MAAGGPGLRCVGGPSPHRGRSRRHRRRRAGRARSRPFAVELVAAVEGGRLADPDDAGYALSLAAEARELAGDHEDALALSARAATTGEGTVDATWLQAIHAERLLRLGREDEGMAALAALRPLLHRDVDAVGPVVEALTETGRAELAEQWVTAAMLTAMEREDRATDGSDEQLEVAAVVDELVMTRRDVRAGLGRVPDEYDTLADDLDAAPDLVFYPEAAFTQLLAAQPEAADDLGRDWDAHRAIIEGELQAADAEGEVLEVEVATPELLAAMLADDDEGHRSGARPPPPVAPGPQRPVLVRLPGEVQEVLSAPRARPGRGAPPPAATVAPQHRAESRAAAQRAGAGRAGGHPHSERGAEVVGTRHPAPSRPAEQGALSVTPVVRGLISGRSARGPAPVPCPPRPRGPSAERW